MIRGSSEVSSPAEQFSIKNSPKVLIADDESVTRCSLKSFCEEEGYNAVSVGSGIKALKIVEEESPDIIILDIQLPDSNGLELLKTVKEINPDIAAILITGYADIRGAVEAMKVGAFDYLIKPLDLEILRKILNSIRTNNSTYVKTSDMDDFVFVSDTMKEVVRIMERLAVRSDVTVLVLGESGTGKSSLCKKMHDLSSRRGKPFVEIGCSNIPEHLIESELFGYKKGAFTDAKIDKKGLIEMAQGGTVFLDEIGDMPYPMQSKILDLIEERRFRRIGGLQYLNADVRIFAATNVNLHDLVQAKKFRLDLFYRLNVVTVEMPPLRERNGDIPLIIDHFMKYYGEKYRSTPKGITPQAMEILQRYPWPGNVRELKNIVQRFVILAKDDEIDVADIPSSLLPQKNHESQVEKREESHAEEPVGLSSYSGLSLRAMEEEFIKTALKLSDGNQRKAAKLLDVTRDTLRYRLKKLGIESPEK